MQPSLDLRTSEIAKFKPLSVTGAGERNRELDGLRGIAISLVLISHFCDQDVPIFDGHAGVRLFFVLSGFLITNILFQCRSEAERGTVTPGTVLLAFYARRCLRIFPTYYLLLAAIGIFDVDQIRGTIWWHAGYASDILAVVRGAFDRVTAHYWTLSIEEQFYLFWPFVVLFIPRSKLSVAAIALVAIGILSRPVALYLNVNFVALYTNPFSSFDAFGLGALLAMTGRNPFLRKVMRVALLLCFVVAPAVVIFMISTISALYGFAASSGRPFSFGRGRLACCNFRGFADQWYSVNVGISVCWAD